jgi:phage-related protein
MDVAGSKPVEFRGSSLEDLRVFRVLYLAKFPGAIFVLHCFRKKTGKTSTSDVELAAKSYRELLKELAQ